MKIFIWDYINKLTDNYHSNGGLVVFAESEERARVLAQEKGVEFDESEIPSEVRETEGQEAVYIFPDAGCC